MRLRGAGFSLIELLIVLSVLGILVAIAVPSFAYLAATTKMKTAASNVHLALLKARSEAVKRDTAVTISANGGAWESGWQMTTAGGTVLQVQDELKGVRITLAPTNITYQSSGRIQGGGAPRFNLEPSVRNAKEEASVQMTRCISVQANGTPYIKEAPC